MKEVNEKIVLYKKIAKKYTEKELANILNVHQRTIRRYAQKTKIKPKPTKYTNKTKSEWIELFNQTFKDKLYIKEPIYKDKYGHFVGTCVCKKCNTEWEVKISDKINNKSGCINQKCPNCKEGHRGNKYNKQEIEKLLNENYQNQWTLLEYNNYSKKNNKIKCNLCGKIHTVNLSDFINTTTKRCTNCQTGSFGEYIIANTLLYNNISYEKEKTIKINNQKYRLDFYLTNKNIVIEYSGKQHFEKGFYYNEKINLGIKEKQKWCKKQNIMFYEIKEQKNIDEIIKALSSILNTKLKKPTPEFFKHNNPSMDIILKYMKTHSAKQTCKDFKIPISKIKKYILLSNYNSISEWQADNQIKQ